MPNSLTTAPASQVPASLATLAEQINFEHGQAEAAMNDGLDHAIAAGKLLDEAKKQCTHGTWLPWLKKNFKGSKRTAQAYLRLHREYPKLKRKAQRVALLSMRQALVNVSNDAAIVARSDHLPAVVSEFEKCGNARRAVAHVERDRSIRPEPVLRHYGPEEPCTTCETCGCELDDLAYSNCKACEEKVMGPRSREQPSKAIFHGNEAIDALKRIRADDELRVRGFQIVADWIRSHCPEAMQEATAAASNLRKPRKKASRDDPHFIALDDAAQDALGWPELEAARQ